MNAVTCFVQFLNNKKHNGITNYFLILFITVLLIYLLCKPIKNQTSKVTNYGF